MDIVVRLGLFHRRTFRLIAMQRVRIFGDLVSNLFILQLPEVCRAYVSLDTQRSQYIAKKKRTPVKKSKRPIVMGVRNPRRFAQVLRFNRIYVPPPL